MKCKTLPTLSTRLKAFIILLILAFIVNSCKKDKSTIQQENITDPLIVQAKGWYEGIYPQSLNVGNNLKTQSTSSTSNGTTDYSQLIKPDWQHASSYDRFNKKVIEIPIDPLAKFSSALINRSINKTSYKKEYSRSSFLLLNDGKNYEAYVMTVFADSAYLNNDLSKFARNTYSKRDADFSGMVLYFTPKGAFVSGALYKNGHIVPAQSNSANTSNTKTQSTGNLDLKLMLEEEVCYDYWEVSYTNGVEDSRSFLFTICEGGNAGGGGGGAGSGPTSVIPPPPPCTIAGSSITGQLIVQSVPADPTDPGDGGGFPPPTPCTTKSAPYTPQNIGNNFDLGLVYNGNGTKPLKEDPDKCTGAATAWNMSVSNNKETVGLLTSDGKFITVAMVGYSGGSWGGLYNFEGTTYYTYPDNQGVPSQTYAGMQHAAGQYFIPIIATVHTHSPCLIDGTDGVSNMTLSSGDQNLASAFPKINHYIIGCNAMGKFSNTSNSPTLLQTGALSATCNAIH